MAIAYSKLTKQSRTTVPAEILQRLGVGPGSLVEWYEKDGQIFIRTSGRPPSLGAMARALLVVCDFLLEPGAPAISPATFAQVQDLLSRMQITDECVARLQEKTAG